MNKQELASKIWESANRMRSKIEASEYKDYIIGFIFYKYLSEYEEKWYLDQGASEEDLKELREDDQEMVKYAQNNIGYFISYENLFSTWIKMGADFDVSNVRDALSAFSRLISDTYKSVFDKIFDTLETGLSKLGDSSNAQTKAIIRLIDLIKDIPMDAKEDYDVLGFIYEYLISQFAANAGKKAGEFYTPHEVSILMSEIVAYHLKDRERIKIYDPTSGSGSLLITIGKSAAKYMEAANGKTNSDTIMYYAQEIKENTYNLTRMNLVMRGIKPSNIQTRNGDTLEEDWPFEEVNPNGASHPFRADAVVSNPPYSQNRDPTDKEVDPRFSSYGIAPRGKADYAFLLHDLYHMKEDGIMTIVLPHGVLFRGGEEGTIRKNLIEKNNIDTIIGLPPNIFFGTGIPTIIMVLKKSTRPDTNVLIIDASKGFVKEGKNNKLRASDIKRISDTVTHRLTIKNYSRLVSQEEIRANDYNLNIPRYVDSGEKAESWDLYSSLYGGIPIREVNELEAYRQAFPTLKKDLFINPDSPYVDFAPKDVKEAIKNHPDVQHFIDEYKKAFGGFHAYLRKELVENPEEVNISREENEISSFIFKSLEQIPLIDKYEAYQILDDCRKVIGEDLEMIQTEGRSAITKVDPHLVIKKRTGREEEVQEGWEGHIIPFELAQEELLRSVLDKLKAKEDRLEEIPGEYEEIIDSLTEEEKESEILSDSNDAFVAKEVNKKIKYLEREGEGEEDQAFLEKLKSYESLSKEEKTLKREIKNDQADLHKKTKETIEGLTEDQAQDLVDKKWTGDLLKQLESLPEKLVDDLINKLKALSEKYETTFFGLEEEIAESERKLAGMLDELTGDEYDLKALAAFKDLLLGGKDD